MYYVVQNGLLFSFEFHNNFAMKPHLGNISLVALLVGHTIMYIYLRAFLVFVQHLRRGPRPVSVVNITLSVLTFSYNT